MSSSEPRTLNRALQIGGFTLAGLALAIVILMIAAGAGIGILKQQVIDPQLKREMEIAKPQAALLSAPP